MEKLKSFSGSLMAWLKKPLSWVVLGGLVLIIIIASSISGSGDSDEPVVWEDTVFHDVARGELVRSVSGMGTTTLGEVELSVSELVSEKYDSRQVSDGERYKSLFRASLRAFNFGYSATDELLIGLEDDLGNQYDRDFEISSLAEIKDFGRALEIYPRTIREGNVVFSELDENAKEFTLIIFSGNREDKVEYNFSWEDISVSE